jgi:hypothetical protein
LSLPSAALTKIMPGAWDSSPATGSRLVVPSPAVTEIRHLLADPQRRGRIGMAAEFCAAIADDELRVIEITPYDYRRMAERLATYSSLRLQGCGCVRDSARRTARPA